MFLQTPTALSRAGHSAVFAVSLVLKNDYQFAKLQLSAL